MVIELKEIAKRNKWMLSYDREKLSQRERDIVDLLSTVLEVSPAADQLKILENRIRDLVTQLDTQNGVPCEQIRHQQQLEEWRERYSQQGKRVHAATTLIIDTHRVWKNTDSDSYNAPEAIKDRNGDIVLGLCRDCGAGECELEEQICPSHEMREDAENWRALMSCPRIRPYGWAGLDAEMQPRGDGVHFGADFWSIGPVQDEQSGPKSTATGTALLKALASDIRARTKS